MGKAQAANFKEFAKKFEVSGASYRRHETFPEHVA